MVGLSTAGATKTAGGTFAIETPSLGIAIVRKTRKCQSTGSWW